ncbi:MAG: response regulator, partial [Acidimicrobiales bacterium]|nr:response regulator [Acidimicrobiales bacterium]
MNATDGIEVVVADDEDDIRLLLKLQLRQFGISVVGEATDGIEAVDVCEATRPHVITLDLLMPNMNGFEAIPGLRRRCPD